MPLPFTAVAVYRCCRYLQLSPFITMLSPTLRLSNVKHLHEATHWILSEPRQTVRNLLLIRTYRSGMCTCKTAVTSRRARPRGASKVVGWRHQPHAAVRRRAPTCKWLLRQAFNAKVTRQTSGGRSAQADLWAGDIELRNTPWRILLSFNMPNSGRRSHKVE